MATNAIHVEYLLSKKVVDSNGTVVGRIEELHGEQVGKEFLIREFMLGPVALIERITAWIPGARVLKFINTGQFGKTYRIPWDKMDLSDPNHPRILLKKSELKPEPQ
jgi:sporulation protein YlmC with PRC-barrel domain